MIPPSSEQAAPSQSQLIAVGFNDLKRVSSLLDSSELAQIEQSQLFTQLQRSANPDQALLLLIRLIEREPKIEKLVQDDEALRLVHLLGISEALGEFLIRRPENLDLFLDPDQAVETAPALEGLHHEGTLRDRSEKLRTLLLESVQADPEAEQPVAEATGKDALVALRSCYRRQLVAITVQDIITDDPHALQPLVSIWLADLASAAMEAALAVARAVVGEKHGADEVAQVEFAVMGMGKCGARELNYISDVDVIYAHEVIDTGGEAEKVSADQGTKIAVALATELSHTIQSPAPESGLWDVDGGLRPEGFDGVLSRTVSSHLEYYQRWAHTWEFQALLKARRIAGSERVADAYLAALNPLIWQASTREGFVTQVQNMRRRVVDNISLKERQREIKLGPGGLRDIEFPAQLLQLVHGKTDPELRVRSTEEALEALQAGGYIGRGDAKALIQHYRFLRLLEHRIQLAHMRRTHLMPEKPEQLRVLARGMSGVDGRGPKNGDDLVHQWKTTSKAVRELFDQIFYRPLLPTTAALPADQVRLSPETAVQRLAALGYQDPNGAIRHIAALTEGVSRRAALQRQLLPAMLGWLAEGPDPDGGLLGFRKLSESLGPRPWYLRMLRDSPDAAERLCQVLSSSRYISEMLENVPDAAAWLDRGKDLQPVPLQTQITEMRSLISRHHEPREAIRHVRVIRRREILRTAMADASGLIDQAEVGVALSNADQATVICAMDIINEELRQETGEELKSEVVVVAMGRQGGREIGYGSDLDVMFMHQPRPGVAEDVAARQAVEIAKRLTNLVKAPVKPALPFEQVLMIDADLRPEGKRGPLVRSLSSYQNYYQQWAEIWEVQALTKFRTIAGPQELQEEFTEWADSVRYHSTITQKELQAIRRMKARVESERLPRGADPTRHVKLGRGGLTDVEWLVQTLQLQYAHEHESLRTPSTMQALTALEELEIISTEDVESLREAWQLATSIRSASMIATARMSDVLPANRDALEAVARWLNYGPGEAGQLEEDYLRVTRTSRAVFEKLFYGLTD